MGNLIAVKKSKSGYQVMLAAHMDRLTIVTNIDENGFCAFQRNEFSPFNVCTGSVFQNRVTAVSYETELDDMKKLKLDKMYRYRARAGRGRKHVQIGDQPYTVRLWHKAEPVFRLCHG